MKIAAVLFLLPFAAAECPNACSGHGECSQYDSCDCYSGFQGGDCSERVCAYNWAWVTTANGDLNFDGDRYDGTVYSTEVRVAQTSEALLTQAAPGGTWESWPYKQISEEGHFYMECSNRGLCDRATGECQCFDGFDGHACNRMVCPEDCNGRGRCKSVSQQTGGLYKKWDRDMARECVCDPGFSGPTCAERLCPYGNDVLTQSNEVTEVQFIKIFTGCEEAATTACAGDVENVASGAQLGGTFTLTYTDHYGESYTTDQIAIDDYDGSSQAVAVAAKAALIALPNNVISDTIEVTASSCYTVDEVAVDFGTAEIGSALDGLAEWGATDLYSVLGSEGIIYMADGSETVVDTATPANNGQGSVTLAGTATTTEVVLRYTNPICLRLKVEFVGMPGDLHNLVVDHSLVSHQGFTNDMHTGAGIQSSVSDTMPITSGKANFHFMNPATVTTGASSGAISGKTITMVTDPTFTNTHGGAKTFYRNSRVEILCQETETIDGSSVTTDRSLGKYTVASITTATMTVVETIVPSDCTAAASTITITQVSNIITSNGDADLAGSFAALDTATSNARIGVNIGASNKYFDSKVNANKIELQLILDDDTAKVAYVILDSEDASIIPSASEVSTPGTGYLFMHGQGTMENTECGDRGLCDTETGECKCFAGYTGDSCHIQKSISA